MVAMMGWRMNEQEWRKGPWTPTEDNLLSEYVRIHGEGRWSFVAGCSGLKRSGKSCRLRWVNYLRPGLKKGQLTPQEEGIIIELHAIWGNKWSTIARYLPGRTDNEIKNYWRTHFKKKGTPSQYQEKQKQKVAFRQNQYQQQQRMNEFVFHVEDNNQGMVFESPEAKREETTVSEQHYNQCAVAQDVASWWDTASEDGEDGLWSGFLWNQNNNQYPNASVI